MQLNLLFRDVPNPSQEVWEQLDERHRGALLEKLAQLMAKAALSEAQKEENDHDKCLVISSAVRGPTNSILSAVRQHGG